LSVGIQANVQPEILSEKMGIKGIGASEYCKGGEKVGLNGNLG